MDISDTIQIKIVKAEQDPIVFQNSNLYTFDAPPNKEIKIVIHGTNGTGFTSYATPLGGIVIDDKLQYVTTGVYTITATNNGDQNYYTTASSFTFEIVPSLQSVIDFEVGDLSYTPVYLDYRNEIILTGSGGSVDAPIVYSTQNTNGSIKNSDRFSYTKPNTSFTINAFLKGNINYEDVSGSSSFSIIKATVRELRQLGFPVSIVKADPYYDIYEIAEVYTLMEIIDGGYTLTEIYMVWKRLQLPKHNACSVYKTKLYTLQKILDVGYRMKFCIR